MFLRENERLVLKSHVIGRLKRKRMISLLQVALQGKQPS